MVVKWTANEIKLADADSLSDAIEENKVLKVPILLFFLAILAGCETLYQNEGISRINSQRDVDAYNATVSAESDMLVCTREQVLGSNIREFVCVTVAQRERL